MIYKPMKICVLNLSGNVGKTTLAAHLLGAFRPLAEVVTIDSLNNRDAMNIDSLNVEELKVSQFRDIYRKMMTSDDLIIDIGASDVGVFLNEMGKHRSAIGEFDLIVIPTVHASKQQKDTIATIELLDMLGFDGGKVRVVFNQHTGRETIDQAYAHVLGYALSDGKNKARWTSEPIVSENEIFELVKSTRKTVGELATDTTDWKALRHQAKIDDDMAALDAAVDGQIAHDLAHAAYANLQQAYKDLFAPYQEQSKAGK